MAGNQNMHLLGKAGPALKAASEPIATVFGELVAQIEQHNRLLRDLQLILSESYQDRVELTRATEQAEREEEKALERARTRERILEGLQKVRDYALAELAKGRRSWRGWSLEKRKKEEVDGLKEEVKRKLQAWEAEKRKLEEEKEKDKKRSQEEIDNLKMGREMENESWRNEVEKLTAETKGKRRPSGQR